MSIASEPDPHSGSPVGVKADATPARRPGPMVLESRFGRVEKLDAARHGAALAEAVLGWRWTFAFLAVGPFLGAAAMLALRRDAASVKLAGGRR